MHAGEEVKIYLIGNKADEESSREIPTFRAIEYAKLNGIHKCYETSAKTGNMVEVVFANAGKELYLDSLD